MAPMPAPPEENDKPPMVAPSIISPSWEELLDNAHHSIDNPKPKSRNYHTLAELIADISRSAGDPHKEFFYIAGPMTGIPQFNFPRFHEVATKLRAQGYNIVSPAELENSVTLEAALSSESGDHGFDDLVGEKSYNDFLGRDLIICALSTCVGAIFLEGWQHSRGARGESWILQFLQKALYEYHEENNEIVLTRIPHRDTRMRELGVDPEGVPVDAPGDKTRTVRTPSDSDKIPPLIDDGFGI